MDGVILAENLMRRGWWSEAEAALNRPDVSPSDRLLETCALTLRREAVERLNAGQSASDLLPDLDRYTVDWVMREYCGEGSSIWQTASEEANGLTD